MTNERSFLLIPTEFKNKCKIYPPTIRQVVEGNIFHEFYKFLTLSQEDIEDIFAEGGYEGDPLTPMEYLFGSAYNDKTIEARLKKGFEFFIHEPVTFVYEQKLIILGDIKKQIKKIKSLDDLRIINEEEFFDFQNALRNAMGEKNAEKPNPNEHPRIKAMKAKARYRDRIKAKKGMSLQFSTSLAALCCMGFGLNPLNIGEMSYAALPTLMRMYQEKEKYEVDIKSLLAGADSKKVKPKYWIRNIEDDD